MFAGWLEQRYAREMPETAAIPQAWSLTFYLLTILFALLFVYHYLFYPTPGGILVPFHLNKPLPEECSKNF